MFSSLKTHSRYQREQLIVRLYREGKSYRDIAKEVRVSVRDIKPVLKKYESDILTSEISAESELHSELDKDIFLVPNSTKAYMLFSKGKNPLQVSIELNLRAPETQALYKEFLELRGMHFLSRLFTEIGSEGLYSIVQLHVACKAQQIANDQIIDLLTTFSNYLPAARIQYQKLQNEIYDLESKKRQLESEIYGLGNTINSSYNFLNVVQAKCNEIKKERNSLAIQKLRLLKFAQEFKNNNEIMTKVDQFVEGKVNSILKQNMRMLEISLASALKAFQHDPNSYRYLLDKSKPLPLASQTHVIKQRSTDYCYACYDGNSEQISLRYFDNLKKEMISEIGLHTDKIMKMKCQ
jgi:hypothetical protein